MRDSHELQELPKDDVKHQQKLLVIILLLRSVQSAPTAVCTITTSTDTGQLEDTAVLCSALNGNCRAF